MASAGQALRCPEWVSLEFDIAHGISNERQVNMFDQSALELCFLSFIVSYVILLCCLDISTLIFAESI